jgi:hypothetical protein
MHRSDVDEQQMSELIVSSVGTTWRATRVEPVPVARCHTDDVGEGPSLVKDEDL